jgi:hypothetical protein
LTEQVVVALCDTGDAAGAAAALAPLDARFPGSLRVGARARAPAHRAAPRCRARARSATPRVAART